MRQQKVFLRSRLVVINLHRNVVLTVCDYLSGALGKGESSQDVVDALELLLQFTPLLDIIDAKWPSSCIESLLTALLKVGLIQEEHSKKYIAMR